MHYRSEIFLGIKFKLKRSQIATAREGKHDLL
jgi:hypothetical protein